MRTLLNVVLFAWVISILNEIREVQMESLEALKTQIASLVTQTQIKFDKLTDLLVDGNAAINKLLQKIEEGGAAADYTAEVNALKGVAQKNADMIAAIESADAQFEAEANG